MLVLLLEKTFISSEPDFTRIRVAGIQSTKAHQGPNIEHEDD